MGIEGNNIRTELRILPSSLNQLFEDAVKVHAIFIVDVSTLMEQNQMLTRTSCIEWIRWFAKPVSGRRSFLNHECKAVAM